jgi:hypothetical protein
MPLHPLIAEVSCAVYYVYTFFMINLKTFSILSTMINIGIVFADYVVIFVNTLLAIRSVNILKPPH